MAQNSTSILDDLDTQRAANQSPDIGDLLGSVLGGGGSGGSGGTGGLGDVLGSIFGKG